MSKILASSPDLDFIENSINKFFYSNNYYIERDSLIIRNKKQINISNHFKVRKIKNRYQFIYVSKVGDKDE